MNLHIKQIAYIILMSIFFSFIRYFFIQEDYPILKPSSEASVETYSADANIDSLKDYLNVIVEPKIINLDLARKIHQFDLATFIDARDLESYQEKHIKGALNITFEMLEEFAELIDLDYIELSDGYVEHFSAYEENQLTIKMGHVDGVTYIMPGAHADLQTNIPIEDKYTIFIVYCSGEGCSLSEDLAFYMLERFNIKKILIYEGGMPEWIENNLPTK